MFVLKLFPEITIKTRPVRKRFIRQLRKNIKSIIREIDAGVEVKGEWDALEVEPANADQLVLDRMATKLCCIPGIAVVLEVTRYPLPDMDGMFELVNEVCREQLKGKTFAVRCKRSGRHSFRSVDVEQYVGRGLNQHTEAAGVKLVDPEVTVALEIRDDSFYIVNQRYEGLGGFPLGCQDSVLSLISGGFDSSVSSYLTIKRGLQTHYCFFNLGGRAHELAVKELALYLWMKYHSSHRVKFISVPFEGVVEEILTKVKNSQMGVILKRMMLRAAEKVAGELNLLALATGESIAQVSSQTLPNLAIIDSVTDAMVLRPLATSNKQEIIDTARIIGTEDFSKNIPEYCAVISNKPTTHARKDRIEREESRFDFAVLDSAIEHANYQLITRVAEDLGQDSAEIKIVYDVDASATIIDIRHPTELESLPLAANVSALAKETLNIPFYQLKTSFDELDREKKFLLYCDKGMMSRLHAAHLLDEGFSNVAVLDLSNKS